MNKLVIISLIFIFYTYLGYPMVLWLLTKMKKERSSTPSFSPAVTVVIAAFNEEESIAKTLNSILESDYPKELLDILVVSDASTDRTDEIVSSYGQGRVRLVRLAHQSGKKKAINSALADVENEIVLVADANSVFIQGTIRSIVRHFADPKVGSSVGSKQIIKRGSSVSKSDGAYWRYESGLRYLESLTGSSCVGVEGGLFAIRKNALVLDFPDDISSDYSIFCNVFMKGYVNRYDPEAIVYEEASKDIGNEFNRKIRVIVRGIRAFFAYWRLLNPIKYPMFFFQNISHRLCRWLVPFLLVIIFFGSWAGHNSMLWILFYLQLLFYGFSLIGIVLKRNKMSSSSILSIPAYFVSMNAAAFVSWFLVYKKYRIWTSRGA